MGRFAAERTQGRAAIELSRRWLAEINDPNTSNDFGCRASQTSFMGENSPQETLVREGDRSIRGGSVFSIYAPTTSKNLSRGASPRGRKPGLAGFYQARLPFAYRSVCRGATGHSRLQTAVISRSERQTEARWPTENQAPTAYPRKGSPQRRSP